MRDLHSGTRRYGVTIHSAQIKQFFWKFCGKSQKIYGKNEVGVSYGKFISFF